MDDVIEIYIRKKEKAKSFELTLQLPLLAVLISCLDLIVLPFPESLRKALGSSERIEIEKIKKGQDDG